ncbi:MAG: cytochrome c biogenesis protein ResB [bacterium]
MAETKNEKRQTGFVDNLLDKTWNLLKSMRFAIILFLIITAASILNLFANEFIISAGSAERATRLYQQAYGGLRADLLMFFQMYSPYRSWWYTLLLGLLLLSLIVCIIDRAPTIWRLAFKPAFPRSGGNAEEMAESAKLAGTDLRGRIPQILRQAGYTVQTKTGEAGELLIDATKMQWARWGAWFVHIGFVLLVLGGAMIARGGYDDRVAGLPGEFLADAQQQQLWGFNARVDDFQILYYPLQGGQWVEVDGKIIGRITRENRDGSFDLDTYSPRMGPMNNITAERISNRIDRKMQGGRLDATNIQDYICMLTVIEDGKEVKSDTIEVNSPMRFKGYRFYQSAYDDRRVDDQGRWTTIINVRRDDGAPFVWAGIFIVSLGLIIGMYFVPHRIVAIVEGEGEKQSASLGGRSERSRTLFAGKFASLVKSMEG